MKTIRVVDLFCGAGGSSSGMKRAVAHLGCKLHMTVINHWQQAVATHCANHPDVEHLCDSLEEIDPKRVVQSGKLDLLWASPSCIGFSNAAGGAPRIEQTRTGAWHVHTWAEKVDVSLIIVENVREFLKWKPLRKDGRPNNRYRNGHTFERWYQAMQDLGYHAEHRVLCSADYGDPTTRERLFLVFRRDSTAPAWPERTHHPEGTNGFQKWVAARKIIDWNVPGQSIFTRKKPLAEKTIARIAAGLRKFGGEAAEPFLVMLYGTGQARSIERPMPTVTAKGQHVGLCEPFVIGQQSGAAPRSVDKPAPTVAAAGAISLVEPFLVNYHGDHQGKKDGEGRVESLEVPLPTQDTANRYGLCEPFVVGTGGPEHQGKTPRSVEKPLKTVLARNHMCLCQPFIAQVNHGRKGNDDGSRVRDIDRPVSTITKKNAHALIEPFIVQTDHGGANGAQIRSIDQPLVAVTQGNGSRLIEPFLVKYNGTGKAVSVEEPMHTIPAKARFGLVEIDGQPYQLDIRFRMLLVKELAGAMGFPSDYEFQGTKADRVRQIGNAVSVGLSSALCYANLLERIKERKTLK